MSVNGLRLKFIPMSVIGSAWNSGALGGAPTLVMVIPLLFEAKMQDLVSEILGGGVSSRATMSALNAAGSPHPNRGPRARINAQMSLAEKIPQATLVLENESDLAILLLQVDAALKQHQSSKGMAH